MRAPKPKRAVLMALSPSTDVIIADKGTTIFIRGTSSFRLSDAEAANLAVAIEQFHTQSPSPDEA